VHKSEPLADLLVRVVAEFQELDCTVLMSARSDQTHLGELLEDVCLGSLGRETAYK
jgi:hypothetical protein